MKKWIDRGDSMGGYRCCTLNDEGYEKCLAGEKGEIWETGTPGHYKCFLVLPSRDEKIYSFSSKDLYKWKTKLKIPVDPKEQAKWANNPNSRK